METEVRTGVAACSASSRGRHSKNALEDVGERRSEIGTEAGTAHPAVLASRMPEAVIGSAFVAVLEHVVGLVEFFETMLAVLIARIAIRMMLHGKLAEGRLEFDLGAAAS